MRMTHGVLACLGWCAATGPATALAASEIGAGGHPLGLGITLGYPSGITGKYYLGGQANALEFLVATWDYDFGGWWLGVNYLWHPSVLASEGGFDLPWHVGVGGFLADSYRYWRGSRYGYYGDVSAGANVPIGLDLNLTDVRLQFSGDAFLRVLLVREVGIDIGLSLSIRYFF